MRRGAIVLVLLALGALLGTVPFGVIVTKYVEHRLSVHRDNIS